MAPNSIMMDSAPFRYCVGTRHTYRILVIFDACASCIMAHHRLAGYHLDSGSMTSSQNHEHRCYGLQNIRFATVCVPHY